MSDIDKSPSETANQVQDAFLNTVKTKRVTVNLFLANGVKLQGRVVDFDRFSILFTTTDKTQEKTQLVFKANVATIMPVD